ncbi:exocyst complex component 7-like [Pomacea canaliculata]|uniref:exocyst complex component 7-like n=1 Tax=Pomacea canaliculata TaxID=400727 RepID=UPI000D739086|nr:exocyst complex component 7-like [Pomacea canaliculata]
MDELAELKYDIDRKLDKEANNLAMLKDCLSRCSANSQNMLGILTSFESRLQRLESTIVPVYNETENLRRRQENIEKTMHSLDTVLSHYHAAKDVEATIKEGPAACDLDTYLACMEKVLKAQKYFQAQTGGKKELEIISHIFIDGIQALQHEFRSLLNRHGHPVPPVVIVDLLSADEDLPPVGTDRDVGLEQLPEKVVTDLITISQWLVEQGQSLDHLKSYGQARANILARSLQGLKEHLRSSSGTSSQLSFISQNSPSIGGKFRGSKDAPSRKSMMRLVNNFTKKASSALNKSTFEPGHRRQGSAANDSTRDDSADLEADLYISELSALLRLMQSELHLMKGIVPQKNKRNVFDTVIQQALDTVVSEGEMIATATRKSMQRHEYSAVLSIFPIVRHLRSIKPEFDLILEGCQAPTRLKLASLLSTLDSTGAKALEEFTDSIRNDPDKASNMPKDGTVHELTNHTIIFLEQLTEYAETAGAMLLMHGEQATPSAMITPETCKMKVADYMTRVLSALGLNLSNKSETYSEPGLRPIFMLNNFNYIIKSLRKTGLLDLLLLWNKEVALYYEEQIREQKRIYSQSWSKVLHYILEMDKPMSLQRAQNIDSTVKLKDKERQNIKDKFTGFNKELEEIHRIQKAYAIPDPELRQQLIKENKEYMVPRYQMFYTKYSVLSFTKNRAKYVKFDVQAVGKLLESFFDASA